MDRSNFKDMGPQSIIEYFEEKYKDSIMGPMWEMALQLMLGSLGEDKWYKAWRDEIDRQLENIKYNKKLEAA